ncbi:MAG TPA: NADH-quinone oxidoreductase subunit H [Acidimicrobiia bacterium]|nr:NADH-quinone oxidoreductase subunit H [Acidimicrobiia bacterium]
MTHLLETLFGSVFWSAVIKVVLAFAFLMLTALVLVWYERRVVAFMQNRVGPNRAGPFGILQTLADGLKLLFKEGIRPRRVEVGMYLAAPIVAMIPAFLIFLVVPIGAPIHIGTATVTLQGADLNIALLFILAMSSVAVYAVVLAGWASGSKYPLLGGVRATAQMISYEAAMGIALVPVVIQASARLGGDVGIGTLSMTTLVHAQEGVIGHVSLPGVFHVLNPVFDVVTTWFPAWFFFPLIISFGVFFTAAIAETNRAPFDLVEAESEIVGGYHTEYSGFRFAMFFLAEYINMFNVSAIAVTLFFGGWLGPGADLPYVGWLVPIFWFLLKTYALLFVFVWIRATMPRLRYDQLMNLGWKRLIPISLGWLVVFTVAKAFATFGTPWS